MKIPLHSKNEDSTSPDDKIPSLRRNCHLVAMTQIGSRMLAQGKIECGNEHGNVILQLQLHANHIAFVIHMVEGHPRHGQRLDWEKEKHLGSPTGLI